MYFVMHPHGINMTGRWVGLSYDGAIVTGSSSMAKTENEAGVARSRPKAAAPWRGPPMGPEWIWVVVVIAVLVAALVLVLRVLGRR
jgi:hypothetical protein